MAEVLYRMPYLMATPRGFEAMISAIRGSRRLTRAHVIHTVVAFGRADGVDYSTLPESRACYEGHRVLSALLQNDFDTFLRTTDQDVLSYAGELLVTQPAYRSLCRPFVESS